MTVTARKYNPGFLTDDELVASFCVRTDEFESMVETLRECTGNANTHQIVIGPRGSGKTSLLLRVAAEIRRDADLSSRFFPIVFAEESYEVSTAGEFWLECLSRLADQEQSEKDSPDLRRTFEDLRHIRDDRMLGDRCLGVLQDFADREDKRLVLIVENLNMLLGDIGNDDVGWQLRHTLQTESRIVLLASATSRFDEMGDPDQPFYDLFRALTLRPLDTDNCATLWQVVSGRQRAPQTIRALRILTGGSPRLFTILARFGAELSFRELMDDLLNLVDDHTEYFKSHLDSLPAQERRVYLALVHLWKPVAAREIAERARLETNQCSAHLKRLTERGVVEMAGGTERRKLYYVVERLYNIYYLMRRARGPAPLVHALVRFMEGYYSAEQLKDLGARMAQEALALEGELLRVYRTAFEQLVQLPSLEAHREELLSNTREAFTSLSGDHRIADAPPSLARQLVEKAMALAEEGRLQEAVDAWDGVIHRFGANEVKEDLGQVSMALMRKGMALDQLQRPDEALIAFEEVLKRLETSELGPFPEEVGLILVAKGVVLGKLNRSEEAVSACDEVLKRFGNGNVAILPETLAMALWAKGTFLQKLNQPEAALSTWEDLLQRFDSGESPIIRQALADALFFRGTTLTQMNRTEEGIAAWNEVVQRFESSDSPKVRERVAASLSKKVSILTESNRFEEALNACEEIIQRFGSSDGPKDRERVAACLIHKVGAFTQLNRFEEALYASEEAVRRFGSSDAQTLRNVVSTALLAKATALAQLNRLEQALTTCDEVLERDGTSNAPESQDSVASALVSKGAVLFGLKRPNEASVVWEEAVRRFGKSNSPLLRSAAEMALLARAMFELTKGRGAAAIELVDRALERKSGGLPEIRWQGRMLRAQAHLVEDDVAACERDVKAALAVLPALSALPKTALDSLSGIAVALGPEITRDLIQASPAADLLLPLTTALEKELGEEPRVAMEVEEVAEDIRRDLEELRKAKSGNDGASTQDPGSGQG